MSAALVLWVLLSPNHLVATSMRPGSVSDPSSENRVAGVGEVEVVPPEPRVSGRLPMPVRRKLLMGYSAASQQIRQPKCQQLFEPFARQGWAALMVTRYAMASDADEKRMCRPGVVAFTMVKSPVTRLCRSFARLSGPGAARVLIHEALHYAGMPEAPMDPTALDSAGINQLVSDHCGV